MRHKRGWSVWVAAAAALAIAGTSWMTLSVGANVLRTVARNTLAVTRAAVERALPGEAWAQQTLEFKPIPAESARAIERRRAREAAARAAARADSVVEHAIPDMPDVPAIPEPPSHGEITRIGDDIIVRAGEVVDGDVLGMGGDVTVEGHVKGAVTSMGGDIYLKPTARVDGDVVVVGGQLHEEDGAQVGGQRVTALGGGKGRIVRRLEVGDRDGSITIDRDDDDGEDVASALANLLVMLLIGWAMARIFPARTVAALDTLRREPAMSVGIGGLVWALVIPSVIALALVVALLCITIIGIPLALAALLGYAAFFVVFVLWGYVVGAGAIGRAVAARQGVQAPTLTRAVVTGVLVLTGAMVVAELLQLGRGPLGGFGTFIKVIVIITTALVVTFGGGAWLRSEFQTGMLGRWWAGRRGMGSFGRPTTAPGVPGAAMATAGAGGATLSPPSPPAYAPPPAPAPETPPSPEVPPPNPYAPPDSGGSR